jgi:hypothetical protein
MNLYHVTITFPPQHTARGSHAEERTYTPWGKEAADARVQWLRERYPTYRITKRRVPAAERSPVCEVCT